MFDRWKGHDYLMKDTTSKNWVPGFIALGITWGSSVLFIKWGSISLTPIGVAFFEALLAG
jgi:hypothetical protein